MRLRAVITFVLVLAAFAQAGGQNQTQTQRPPPPQTITETVTVSAREATIIANAVNMLRSSRDPLVAKTVADNIVKLTEAMAASGRVQQIGPLSEQERAVVKLDTLLAKHMVAGGPIRLQVRGPESIEGGPVYTLTRSSFISLCADIGSTGFVEFRVIQEIKMIVLARMIADLNEQQHELIPEREILEGVLLGFKDQDPKGLIIGRVLNIADAMAVTGGVYDLVPADQQQAFADLGHMDRGVFEAVPQDRTGMANVRYRGQIFTTSVNHFVWFFIRFLLAEQGQGDWNTLARRKHLGGQLLDYLTLQLQAATVDAALSAIDKAGPAGPSGIVLGDFFARGPGLNAVRKAPGLSQQASPLGSDYRVLVISPKEAQKLPELRKWLEKAAKDLKNKIGS